MPCIRTESFEVFADYHQFYVQDGVVNPPAPEDWTDADVAHRAKAATNLVVVCPVRNMTVPVQVELHDVAPELQDKAADHLVERSLALPSGYLQVHECTGGAVLNWELEPGSMKLLFCIRAGTQSARTDSPATITTEYCCGSERNALFAYFRNGARNELEPLAAADGFAAR